MYCRNQLLISNVPRSCSEEFLKNWVEARRYRVFRLNLIRDVISDSSPSFAYVQLMDESKLDEAVRALDRQSIAYQTVVVERVGATVRPVVWIKAAS